VISTFSCRLGSEWGGGDVGDPTFQMLGRRFDVWVWGAHVAGASLEFLDLGIWMGVWVPRGGRSCGLGER
jgi:hypothetical protein